MHLEWVDMLGNPIFPGDIIAYATASHSSAYMKFGEIVEILSHNKRGQEYTCYDYVTRSQKPYAALKVIGLPLKNSGGRTSVITHLNKVLKYDRNLLPADYF
jgi:hypothetical protein